MLLALAACLAALGCGRKATVEDCEQIVRRIAELELQGTVSKEELGTEVDQAQQAFRERALADCVGRRITEKSLACVATAKTPEAVIDDCFD
jgi:N-acetylglutamate synthase-like GNAT family acetyltransferase